MGYKFRVPECETLDLVCDICSYHSTYVGQLRETCINSAMHEKWFLCDSLYAKNKAVCPGCRIQMESKN